MIESSAEEEPSTPPKAKKAKVNEKDDIEKSLLSPEQKSRIEMNKIKSQILLKCKKFPGTLTPNIGHSWFEALLPEFAKESFEKLDNFLQSERKNQTIFPPFEDVWNWTSNFELSETKVVILGQDPYHGPKQAHGLCFSVQKGVSPPPSLVNMYKELESNIEGFKRPTHGDLSGWASQGVLLLNACLTVRQGQPNSHKDRGWEKITDAAIKAVSEKCPPGVVFLLWGAFAQKKAALVDSKKHHILKSVHPSPLSAHRGFLGCKHFSKCNQLLEEKGRKPVDWTHLP